MLDVDGVLLHDSPAWTENLHAELGIDPAEIRKFFFAKHWHKIVVGRADITPMLERALRQMRSDVTPDALMRYWFQNDARLNRSVLDALEGLRRTGHRVFLCTNQEHKRAKYLMDTLELRALVDGIAYSAKFGDRKPHRPFFEAATRMTAEPPEAHLLIDDSEANVRAARKFGWKAHHWTGQQTLERVIALHD